MKKIEFDYLVSHISDKHIEEAVFFKPKKAIGVKFIAIAACLAVLVASIPLTLLLSKKDSNNVLNDPISTTEDQYVENTTDPEPIPVIYCDTEVMSLEELQESLFKDKEVKLEEFVAFEFRYLAAPGNHVVIERTPDIPETISFNLRGKEYIGVLDFAYVTETNTTNETLKSLTKFARYKIEGTPSGIALLNVASKKIIGISALNPSVPLDVSLEDLKEKELSEEEIGEKAYEDIKSLYGEEIASYFSLSNIFSSNSKGYSQYTLEFKCFIGEYNFRTSIIFSYNYEGELKSMQPLDSGSVALLEFLTSQINESILAKAEKEAMILIEDRLVKSKIISIRNDGSICVGYALYLGTDDNGYPISSGIWYSIE